MIHDLGPGGAEKLIVDLARLAPEGGIDLSVVSLMPFGDHRYPRVLDSLGIPVRSLELRSRYDPRGASRLTATLAGLDPDIVHTHLKHADLLGGQAAADLGIPQVSSLHVIEDAPGPVARLKRDAGMRTRERTAARTIAVSDAVRAWYLDTFANVDPRRVVVIHNGIPAPPEIPEPRIAAARAEFDVEPHGLLVPLVAIMRPGKGHEDLLEAVSLMTAESGITFVFAGSGPEEGRLRQLAARVGVEDRVRFAGYRTDVPEILAASDFVVHPTHADALPTAVVQAAAASVPAVATEVGGVPEVVTPDTGILVPVGDPAALVDGIIAMAADGDRRDWMGKRAKERFDEMFDGRVWLRRLRELYDEVVAQG
ncbi:MAG: glycosyltransferase [Acidimicrobiia bacterium]|nr:glycosyltransferase [Acidimicrobiia bacterium]